MPEHGGQFIGRAISSLACTGIKVAEEDMTGAGVAMRMLVGERHPLQGCRSHQGRAISGRAAAATAAAASTDIKIFPAWLTCQVSRCATVRAFLAAPVGQRAGDFDREATAPGPAQAAPVARLH